MTTWFTKRRHDPGPRGQRCGTGRDLSQDCVFVSPQIGTTNFFWSFPSEAGVKLQQELGRQRTHRQHLPSIYFTFKQLMQPVGSNTLPML